MMAIVSIIWLFLSISASFIINGVVSVEMFGTPDPWSTKLSLTHSNTTLADATNLVVLLDNKVESDDGVVFAFVARIHSINPFRFQIWRLVDGSLGEHQLISERLVIPTVREVHEEFYMFADQCLRVVRGDRLGVYFETSRPPVYYGSHQFKYRVQLTGPPTVGSRHKFESALQVLFVATGFVVNSTTPIDNNTHVQCPVGVRVRSEEEAAVSSTTYVPPTGIPGMMGATGPQGATGPVGLAGQTGDQGLVGNTGATGATGFTGPIGPPGENNTFVGEVGEVGMNGSLGEDGPRGQQGPQGATGAVGPVGEPGSNYTHILYGPYKLAVSAYEDEEFGGDRWWASSKAIEIIYIWLAVATFVFFIALIFCVVACCQCRALRKYKTV